MSDVLWQLAEPPLDDRKALTGIVYVPETGARWEHLPAEMGCGSGMTCWTSASSVEPRRLHRVRPGRLNSAGKIDWTRAAADTTSARAMRGGKERATAPRTAGRRCPSTGR